MASLIHNMTENVAQENDKLKKLSSHPMFEDLQATLATDCVQTSVPYSICNNQRDAELNDHIDPAVAAVQEANLHSQFRSVASGGNEKVQELQRFYNAQCAEIESQRSEAVFKVKSEHMSVTPEYQSELSKVHADHDRQRIHLTNRIMASLQLLKISIPESCDSSSGSGSGIKTKSRTLNSRAVKIMTDWFDNHLDNPYPREEEKEMMAQEGGISLSQVKAWFANRRNRTSNTKPKKQKQQVEKKLLSICTELSGDNSKTPRLYGDIIQQLSDIVNRSTIFNQNISPMPTMRTVPDSTLEDEFDFNL